jgi:hypothetical protein
MFKEINQFLHILPRARRRRRRYRYAFILTYSYHSCIHLWVPPYSHVWVGYPRLMVGNLLEMDEAFDFRADVSFFTGIQTQDRSAFFKPFESALRGMRLDLKDFRQGGVGGDAFQPSSAGTSKSPRTAVSLWGVDGRRRGEDKG